MQDAANIEPHFGPHSIRKTCASAYFSTASLEVASYVIGDSARGVVAGFYINPTARIRKAVDELPQPEAFLSIFNSDSPSPSSNGSAGPGCLCTDWQFGFKSASYRGVGFELGVRPLALLRALVAAGRPLSFDELKTLFWNAPAISKTTIKTTIKQLREALCHALNLPAGWDPVPHTSLYLDNRVAPENGQDGYTLWLP